MRLLLLALACAAACFAACSAATAKLGMPKGAMLWVYRCDDNATSWQELVQYLGDVAKPAGVTSVSLCAYRIKADGSFGYRASVASPVLSLLPSRGTATVSQRTDGDWWLAH